MELLHEMLIILALSTVVLFVCHKLRVPVIVGFLVTGVLAGPHGLGFISDVHEVEVIAEVGVILLLFTIGIEFSVEELSRIKRSVFLGGSLQVLLTIGAVFLLAMAGARLISGWNVKTGSMVFFGLLAALSSTAIVMKLLQEKAQVESPHGQTCLAVLIFQDIAIVPMVLLTPLLAGTAESPVQSFLIIMGKGVVVVGMILFGARYLIPRALDAAAGTRSRELFLLAIVVLCFGVAWLTYLAGLSLALGAFLAGLIISESEYSHQAMANIMPFKDVFTSFFFISIGMLLDMGVLFHQAPAVLASTVGILVLKTLFASIAVVMLGFPLRIAVIVGLSLSQVGEFSFVLSKEGLQAGLMTEEIYQLFLAVSVLTMMATPFIMAAAPRAADFFVRLPFPDKLKRGFSASSLNEKPTAFEPPTDHLIIVGFGMTGKNLALAARLSHIPYTILEMNPRTVITQKKQGEPIHFGDAAQPDILIHAGIKEARVIQIAIPDIVAARAITKSARNLNPAIHIIVRTRFYTEVKILKELGADDVVAEEFETSIEIFTRVLMKYLVPQNEIEKFTQTIRANSYRVFRAPDSREFAHLYDIGNSLPSVVIRTFRISEESEMAGKTLARLEFRKAMRVTVLAVGRNDTVIANPDAAQQLLPGDNIIVLGQPDAVYQVGTMAEKSSNITEG